MAMPKVIHADDEYNPATERSPLDQIASHIHNLDCAGRKDTAEFSMAVAAHRAFDDWLKTRVGPAPSFAIRPLERVKAEKWYATVAKQRQPAPPIPKVPRPAPRTAMFSLCVDGGDPVQVQIDPSGERYEEVVGDCVDLLRSLLAVEYLRGWQQHTPAMYELNRALARLRENGALVA